MVSGAPYSLLETVRNRAKSRPGVPVTSWFSIFTKTDFFAFFEFWPARPQNIIKILNIPYTRTSTSNPVIRNIPKKSLLFPQRWTPHARPGMGEYITFFAGCIRGIIRAKSAMTLCMINNDTDSHEGYFSPCEPLYDK